MKAASSGDAGQGWGVSSVCRVGFPRGRGRALRALRTPGTHATPGHAELPGPVAGAMAWQ
jgi:hypothetical protein